MPLSTNTNQKLSWHRLDYFVGKTTKPAHKKDQYHR